MPAKKLQIEDLTATLQVPIPGIPGAYGEIELSGDGTATVALGAEVPIPILEDMVNAEVQLEIDKEGEIAYGVEINLVGLNLEVMIRGCDIVTTVSYGALSTEAVYTIPDCKNPGLPLPEPPQPEPPPPNIPDPPIRTPPNLPDVPPDEPIAILVYCSYYQHRALINGSLTTYTATRNIQVFKPGEGTEWHKTTGQWINQGGQGIDSENEYEFGWVNNISSFMLYDRWGAGTHVSYRRGLALGTGFPAVSAETVTSPPYEVYPGLRFFGQSMARGDYGSHWVYIGTIRSLTELFTQIPDAYDYWSSWGNGNYILTRSIIAVPWLVDKKPPLQGEPPMKDCCKDMSAELRRLRKELKEIRTAFNPEGFTEKILPPKYDKDGKKIKSGNGKTTLSEVLKEIGEGGSSGSYDPQIAKIDDANIPVSWRESEPQIKQDLPKEKVTDEWIYREMFGLLHEIRYALDPHDIRESVIPSRFIHPGVSDGYEEIRNYPELFKNIFLMLDKVGFQPFQVQVDDTNPAVAGNQTEIQQYHSMGAALESTIKYLIDIEGDQDAHTSFLVRLAYEVILLHQISATTQQTVSNIQDFLGYELRKKKESIPMAFNPLADNPANRSKVDENTEESIEQLLPNLLKNGAAETTVEEYVGRKDLIDFLFEILNAARQKPKGNRLG